MWNRFTDAVGQSISRERFRTVLSGFVRRDCSPAGRSRIFGVISYSASQRSHEIGIRMAVGAQRSDILRLILGQGAKLAVSWFRVLALVFALLLTRLMASLLYDVSPDDPTDLWHRGHHSARRCDNCLLPSREARLRVDPMVALRPE